MREHPVVDRIYNDAQMIDLNAFIDIKHVLTKDPATKLDMSKFPADVQKDMVARLKAYLHHAPAEVKLGIMAGYLNAPEGASKARIMTDAVHNSGALLQKLVQIFGSASAAAAELNSVKSKITPMTPLQLDAVMTQAQGSDWWAEYEAFQNRAIGAGSIGEGHLALAKNGEEVFVKVLRPNVRQIMKGEQAALNAVPAGPRGSLAELAQQLTEETEFLREVANYFRLSRPYEDAGVHVVKIRGAIPSLNPQILIMDKAPGVPLSDAKIPDRALKATLAQLDLFSITWFQNAFAAETSVYHGDPHSGNLMVDFTGSKALLTVIDFGNVGWLDAASRSLLLELAQGIMNKASYEVWDILSGESANYRLRYDIEAILRVRQDSVLKKMTTIMELAASKYEVKKLTSAIGFAKAMLQLIDTRNSFAIKNAESLEMLGLQVRPFSDIMREAYFRVPRTFYEFWIAGKAGLFASSLAWSKGLERLEDRLPTIGTPGRTVTGQIFDYWEKHYYREPVQN